MTDNPNLTAPSVPQGTPETLRQLDHHPSCRVSVLPYDYADHSSRPPCTCGIDAHADAWKAQLQAERGVSGDLAIELQRERRERAADRTRLEAYNELIYAVATKHTGETRHQTALRYIREAETRNMGDGKPQRALAAEAKETQDE